MAIVLCEICELSLEIRILKIGVLGTGSAGVRHLRVLDSLDGVTPVAIPVRAGRVSELLSHGFSVARDLDEACSMGVTAVVIATNTGRHLSDSFTAFKLGFDVLVEKPLGVNSEEAYDICKYARDARKQLYVACDLRFSPDLNEFRTHVESMGILHSVRVEAMSYLPDWRVQRPYTDTYSARSNEGGVLRDLIHEIDYAGWIYGWPISCQAQIRNLGLLGIAAEEIAELQYELPSVGLVSISLDYLTRHPIRRMRSCGSNGDVTWDALAGTVDVNLCGSDSLMLRFPHARDDTTKSLDIAFVESCNGIVDPRMADGEDGYRALVICDAARLSSSAKKQMGVSYKL